ncbi:hypothetical protein K443DRAFT_674181 [Laccaria amethystina LaAM-08-1]|uniref:PPP4R2-domain-containing protein n=1 Tax=Laccaria amethystina LaAM-08-1 TaxID=1095629 RepID=A0A0C9XN38_9AGAR|nr:hypothetical protein K443DRAFT_674181 [Laccaria amethystina LaAM-08-1]
MSDAWLPEYDTILEDIASTDVVKSEWPKLRDIIKAKLEKNILFFLSTTQQPERPAPFHPTPLITGGLKLPPFPPRKLNQLLHANDVPVSYMNEQQANELKGHIFVQLDEFDLDNPPFTIQRLCELCIHPRRNYNSVGKYLRAVEKSILVTSTQDSFPPLTEAELDSSGRSAIALGSTRQSAPSTPLFSPIPFLHDDARRSKSRSPPPTPLTLGPSLDGPETKALGLVDELDDPSPGHLSEHPTALTSTTTVSKDAPPHSRPFLGSLEQRFVKSEDVDGNNASTVQGDSNSMILDDDKENTKS